VKALEVRAVELDALATVLKVKHSRSYHPFKWQALVWLAASRNGVGTLTLSVTQSQGGVMHESAMWSLE
jgi:hypothetical protein